MKHKALNSWQNGNIKVIDCASCRYVHQWPLPNPADLKKFYRDEFYQKFKSDYIKEAEKDKKYREYLAQCVFLRLKNLKGNIRRKRILDVGCSTGIFLGVFKKSGWHTWGVEPSDAVSSLLERRGVTLIGDTVEDVNEMKFLNYFNVIYMRQVLDHLLNPREVIKKLYKMTADDGFICIESPNEFNPLQMAYIKKTKSQMWWITKEHINNFNTDSLAKLVESCGFKLRYIESGFPLEIFLLMGMDYRKNNKLGKKVHMLRKNFEMSLHDVGLDELRGKIYQKLAEIGVGRTFTIFAQKE